MSAPNVVKVEDSDKKKPALDEEDNSKPPEKLFEDELKPGLNKVIFSFSFNC